MQCDVRELVQARMPNFPLRRCGKLVTDTSEFMRIGYGDVIQLADEHYIVLKDECERRFGLEDPKYWVKRCRHLESGESKILKLVFHEQFVMRLGAVEVLCHRSPEKEARILLLTHGDMRFMQGVTLHDERKNPVRILDVIRGRCIDEVVDEIPVDHERYFHTHFPPMLQRFIGACEAIEDLHTRWEKHGDIRRDHLLVERATGRCRWIDFDYAFDSRINPFGLDIFGLGNILLCLVGKRVHTFRSLREEGVSDNILNHLAEEDMSLMFPNRLMNLRKVYPYIPEELNRALMHFAAGAEVFYESVGELLEDLRPVARARRVEDIGASSAPDASAS